MQLSTLCIPCFYSSHWLCKTACREAAVASDDSVNMVPYCKSRILHLLSGLDDISRDHIHFCEVCKLQLSVHIYIGYTRHGKTALNVQEPEYVGQTC